MDPKERKLAALQKAEMEGIMETLRVALGEKYHFHRMIGCGGMGYIFLAEHRQLHSMVAFKVLQSAFNRDAIMVARFQQEAKAAAQLAHPNIIPIYDIGHIGDHNYFIMRYIEGEDLSSLLKREGRLSGERVTSIGAQVADALQYAHKNGVIHRDIKPANILLDQHGNAVVTDFGIARFAASTQLTVQGAILGTPHYMSPEQVRGETVDFRCDQYSLGAVLYHLLSGRHTHESSTSSNLIFKLLYEDPDPLESLYVDASPALIAVIRRLLAKDPRERFESAAEAAHALRKAGQKPALPPDIPGERLPEEKTALVSAGEDTMPTPSQPTFWEDKATQPEIRIPPSVPLKKVEPGDLALMREDEMMPPAPPSVPAPPSFVRTVPAAPAEAVMPAERPPAPLSAERAPAGSASPSMKSREDGRRTFRMIAAVTLCLAVVGGALLVRNLFFMPSPEKSELPPSQESSRSTAESAAGKELLSPSTSLAPLPTFQEQLPITAEEARLWQKKAEEAIREKRLTAPEGDNALFYFRELEKIEGFRTSGQAGIRKIFQIAQATAIAAEKEARWEEAESWYMQALRIDPQSDSTRRLLASLKSRPAETSDPPAIPERKAAEPPAVKPPPASPPVRKNQEIKKAAAEFTPDPSRIYTTEEVDTPAQLLDYEPPVYPPDAKKRGLEDSILVQAVITETGEVTEARTLRHAVEDPQFEISALDAIRKCRFLPARLKGKPVRYRHSLEIHFRLKPGSSPDAPAREPAGKNG